MKLNTVLAGISSFLNGSSWNFRIIKMKCWSPLDYKRVDIRKCSEKLPFRPQTLECHFLYNFGTPHFERIKTHFSEHFQNSTRLWLYGLQNFNFLNLKFQEDPFKNVEMPAKTVFSFKILVLFNVFFHFFSFLNF